MPDRLTQVRSVINRIRGPVQDMSLIMVLGVILCLLVEFTVGPRLVRDWALANDFSRFWYVGARLLPEGWAGLGWAAASPAALAKEFPLDILSTASQPLRVWLYPPTMNLLAMLFALLPLSISFLGWVIGTLFGAAWLLRRAGMDWRVIVLGLISPSGIADIQGGQTGLLLGALLVACLLLADKRPVIAGILASGLCVKPQSGLILLAVLPWRSRRLLLAALLSGICIVALSLLCEGTKPWFWFFSVGGPTGLRIITSPFLEAFPSLSVSVFMMARAWHASLPLAWAFQVLAAATALVLTSLAWRTKTADPVRRMAFTAALACFVSPYGFNYDMVGFEIAMAAMLLRSAGLARLMYAAIWFGSGFSWLAAVYHGILSYPLFAAAAAGLCWPFHRTESLPAAATALRGPHGQHL